MNYWFLATHNFAILSLNIGEKMDENEIHLHIQEHFEHLGWRKLKKKILKTLAIIGMSKYRMYYLDVLVPSNTLYKLKICNLLYTQEVIYSFTLN